MILTDEFARQASMERDLAIPSALFAPPVREIVELGQSQVGFMNMFAIPLFQGITGVLPAMRFCVDELQRNCKIWEDRIEVEQENKRKGSDDSVSKDGAFSPRHMSTVSAGKKSIRGSTPPGASPASSTEHLGNQNSQKNYSRSPLSSPDSTFSHFRSLTDLPKTDQVERTGHLSSETLMPPQYSLGRQNSKPAPANLQLPFTTASAPGLVDHPSQATDNGVNVDSTSLVTDAVVPDPPVKDGSAAESFYHSNEHTRSTNSDPFNGVRADRPEWAENGTGSQATSATTGKLPLSPSTQGTSVMSDENDLDSQADDLASVSNTVTGGSKTERSRGDVSTVGTSTPASRDGANDRGSKSWSDLPAGSGAWDRGKGPLQNNENEKQLGLIGAVKGLGKKPSRSRFRFWKKKGSFTSSESTSKEKEDTPPLPTAEGASPRR